MRRFGDVILFGLIGGFGAGVAALALGWAIAVVFSVSQMEGAYAMGLAFFWMPLAALIGLIGGAVYGFRYDRRQR